MAFQGRDSSGRGRPFGVAAQDLLDRTRDKTFLGSSGHPRRFRIRRHSPLRSRQASRGRNATADLLSRGTPPGSALPEHSVAAAADC